MAGHVFVYGSLLADEVVQALLHRLPRTEPATVKGFNRHGIKNRAYPAVIKSSDDHQVEGRVLCDLSEAELLVLDDFEDEDYCRAVVKAELKDGKQLDAAMYVWQDAYRHLLSGSWDYAQFREKSLERFLAMMAEWETSAEFPEDTSPEIPDRIS